MEKSVNIIQTGIRAWSSLELIMYCCIKKTTCKASQVSVAEVRFTGSGSAKAIIKQNVQEHALKAVTHSVSKTATFTQTGLKIPRETRLRHVMFSTWKIRPMLAVVIVLVAHSQCYIIYIYQYVQNSFL